jgi:hypothetical protein
MRGIPDDVVHGWLHRERRGDGKGGGDFPDAKFAGAGERGDVATGRINRCRRDGSGMWEGIANFIVPWLATPEVDLGIVVDGDGEVGFTDCRRWDFG